ncbi:MULTISPECIES: thiamine-phosphate kinase [Kocuria]|uniref:Thiamine-monophosphate kinase n=1 Tax=Kocuria subflava TaxID=1736139 RepID=A0A846TQR2_9MICC|nr:MULTISPECIES: thiamine-phosphate kinase [Kocuria]NKE09149.1 thiamine-phosphate kinase [Kocuria subflava]
MNQELTVGQLSEGQLIARFAPLLAEQSAASGESAESYQILGPGDDCAVVAAPDGRFVISTDTQVQGQDFALVWPSGVRSSGFDTGHKCATQNVADAAAMGAVPSSLVVSLTLPKNTPVRWVEDLARGLRAGTLACQAPQCHVVGGDLGAGGEISVTATVTGDLQGRDPVRRNGARPGDQVVLAGTVGRAAAGLDLLLDPALELGRDPQLDALVNSQLRPVSPTPWGARLAQSGATSMIDASDGLVRDLTRVATASGVEIVLNREALEELAQPLRPAGEILGQDPLHWVLNGGEDHGLLSTVPADRQLPAGVLRLGSVRAECTAATGVTHTERIWLEQTPVSQLPLGLRGRGWDHFESEDGF